MEAEVQNIEEEDGHNTGKRLKSADSSSGVENREDIKCSSSTNEELKLKLELIEMEPTQCDETSNNELCRTSTAKCDTDTETADEIDGNGNNEEMEAAMVADEVDILLETDCGMLRGKRPKPPVQFHDEDDEITIGITPLQASRLNTEERKDLYLRGTKFEKQGKKELALKCYLRCMMGVSDREVFPFLGKCLHDTAKIYKEKGELKKANQFLKAEKMYKTSVDEKKESKESNYDSVYGPPPPAENENVDADTQMKTAAEYEMIAEVYLKKNELNLAIEYAAKSVKLKQRIYGMQHHMTQQGLDFFANVYAEAGKQRMIDTLKQRSLDDSDLEEDRPSLLELKVGNEDDDDGHETISTPIEKSPKQKKEVTFGGTSIIAEEDPDWLSLVFLKVLLVLAFIIFSILGLFLYCRRDHTNAMCLALSQHSNHITDRIGDIFH